MTRGDLCRRADVVRDIALETVLILRGAVRDRSDRSKWRTEQGPLSVSGAKFMNWQQSQGGGGAIDLVMHLDRVDFRTAVAWLEQQVAASPQDAGQAAGPATLARQACRGLTAARSAVTSPPGRQPDKVPHLSACYAQAERCGPLRLPTPDDRLLGCVHPYLTQRRHLAAALLEPLLECGRLYADSRGNAVFVLVAGRAQRPVGAELRGTGPRAWRGMAPGTRKDAGYFWIGTQGCRDIVLCESAIDAISCFQIHSQRICISTSGVRVNPPWLSGLIARGYRIHCGFDTDDPGEAAATRMCALHTGVQRLRPPAHDWNDALASGQ